MTWEPGFCGGDTAQGDLGFAATEWGGKTWHSIAGIPFIRKIVLVTDI